MRVIILPEVGDYFVELVETLYQKEYFGFRASAREYVTGLIDAIRDTLPNRVHRPAPSRFDPDDKGVWLATFRKNRTAAQYL